MEPASPLASFIFSGRVEQFGATTERGIEIRDATVVVLVTQALRTPDAVGDLTGTRLTVHLKDPQSFKVGDEAIFYAAGVVYGQSIVVEEVSPPELLTDENRVQHIGRVRQALLDLPDRQLQAHADESDLVVVARVADVQPARAQTLPISHHDPVWYEATLQVQSVETGRASRGVLKILFSASRDVSWHNAPKLLVGQEGVFILHRQFIEELNAENYVLLHPIDFQPREQTERIRRLLKLKKP
jgi:hypothetical protein